MRCRPILPYSAPPRFDQSHNSIAHTRWSDTPEAIKSGTKQGDQMELGNGNGGSLLRMVSWCFAGDAEAINSGTDASLLSSRATVYRADFNITTVPLENGWGGRLGLVGRDRNRLQMEMGVSSYTPSYGVVRHWNIFWDTTWEAVQSKWMPWKLKKTKLNIAPPFLPERIFFKRRKRPATEICNKVKGGEEMATHYFCAAVAAIW